MNWPSLVVCRGDMVDKVDKVDRVWPAMEGSGVWIRPTPATPGVTCLHQLDNISIVYTY